MKTNLAVFAGLTALLIGCGQSSTHTTDAGAPPTAAEQTAGATTKESAGKIAWVTDFDKALAQAKQENKPVLVDFYADWCGPCKMMDKQTYTDAAVISEMNNWINVKIDVDKNEALSKRYDISAIPTTVLLSPDGKTISSKTGFIGASEYAAMIKSARPTK